MQYIQSQPICLKKLTPAARREHTKNKIGFVHFTLNQYILISCSCQLGNRDKRNFKLLLD